MGRGEQAWVGNKGELIQTLIAACYPLEAIVTSLCRFSQQVNQAPLSRRPTPRPLTRTELSEAVPFHVAPSSSALCALAPWALAPAIFLELHILTESPEPILSAADTLLRIVWVVNVRRWQWASVKGQMASLLNYESQCNCTCSAVR